MAVRVGEPKLVSLKLMSDTSPELETLFPSPSPPGVPTASRVPVPFKARAEPNSSLDVKKLTFRLPLGVYPLPIVPGYMVSPLPTV